MTFLTYYKYTLRLSLLSLILMTTGCSNIKQKIYGWAMDLELAKAHLTRKQVMVDNHPFVYLESKKKPKEQSVLLIHGFGANKENWIRFAGNFSKQYHVVALDLPGHGESFKDLNLHYDIDDQVAYVHAFADKIGLKTFHIVGNSMGGAISALYAATYPKQVLTVTLIDPGGIFDYPSDLSKALEKGKNPLIVRKPGDMEKLMNFALVKKPFLPWPVESVMEKKSIANAAINDKIFKDITTEPHKYDFKKELTEIKAPTLIMWGREDRAIAVKNADVFQQLIPNSKKVIFDGVGHAAMIEIPEKSAQVFLNFIKQR
jgi:pimeloyl-ACP methyl ester carboxylesterase